MKNEPITIVDGEALYQRFVNDLNEINSKITGFANDWNTHGEVFGKFNIEWLSALLKGNAFNLASPKIREKAMNEPAHQVTLFVQYYQEEVHGLIRLFNSLQIGKVDDKDYPQHLRNLNGFSLLKNGSLDLNEKFLNSIRSQFDEVLTDPADIEFYNLMSSTADSINELIAAAEKRGFAIIGNSFMQLFADRGIGEKVKPNTNRLKFKLSLNK